jgi:two-component SAPR family response regulator
MEAMDYLLKPVDKTRLAETIDRARQSAQERKAASPCLGLSPVISFVWTIRSIRKCR